MYPAIAARGHRYLSVYVLLGWIVAVHLERDVTATHVRKAGVSGPLTVNMYCLSLLSLAVPSATRKRAHFHSLQRTQSQLSLQTTVNSIVLAIGNTYCSAPSHKVPWDRSGRYPNVPEFTLYVDVIISDWDDATVEHAIDQVSFDLGSTFKGSPFICHSPIRANNNGLQVWRFQTRPTACASVCATLEVRGAGGTVEQYEHSIKLNGSANSEYNRYSFTETRQPRPLRMFAMPPHARFGVELECTSSRSLKEIRDDMPVDCRICRDEVKPPTSFWKLVDDASIKCNSSNPKCTTFELVSPVLEGGDGLAQIQKICQALKDEDKQVNKSAGFHVHIDVYQYSLKQIIKICQQYIKYESALLHILCCVTRRDISVLSLRFVLACLLQWHRCI